MVKHVLRFYNIFVKKNKQEGQAMKLEEAIKQKTPFKSVYQKVVVNLFFTHNWMNQIQKESLKPFGVTLQQYNVLRILRGQHPKPVSTSDIRSRMLDRMSDVSRIIDRLLKKDLVERQICKSDKRLVDVVISSQGLDLLQQIDAVQGKIDGALSNLSQDEADKLNELLDKLRG